MAGFSTPVSTFVSPPDWTAQQAEIQRRLGLAQALQQQGLADADSTGNTKMAGQIAIPNSWAQGLAAALKTGVGVYQQNELAKQQKDLYQNQQKVYNQAGQDLMTATTPRPATPAVPGIAPEDADPIDGPQAAQAAQPAYTPNMSDLGAAFAKYLGTTGRNDLAAPFMLQNAQRQIMMSQLMQPDASPQGAPSPAGAPAGTPVMPAASPDSPPVAFPSQEAAAAAGQLGAPTAAAPSPTPPSAPPNAGGGSAPTIGGVPQALAMRLMAADPTGKALANAQTEIFKIGQTPINVRPQGTVYMPGQGPTFTAPGANGTQINWQNGQPSAAVIPGAQEGNARQAGLTEANQKYGALPYAPPTVLPTNPPTLSTPSQQITQAGGAIPTPNSLFPMPGQQPPAPAPSGAPPQIVDASQMPPMPPGDAAIQNAAFQAGKYGPVILRGNPPQGSSAVPAGAPQFPTIAQKTAQEANEQQLAKEAGATRDAANVAQDTNFNLSQMRTALQGFDPGKFTTYKQAAAAALNGIAPSLMPAGGLDSLTNYTEFNKYAMKLGFDQARKMGARESTQIVQMSIDSNPNAEQVKPAVNALINGLTAQNDYIMAKAKAQDAYQQQHGGTLGGFNSWWQGVADPRAFLLSYQSPPEQAKLIQSLPASDRTKLANSITGLRQLGVLQ